MNKLTKILIGALAGLGIVAGANLLSRLPMSEQGKLIKEHDVIEPAQLWRYRPAEGVDKLDVDGDGVQDTVREVKGSYYFLSGAEPQGWYRHIKPGTDIADRLKRYLFK